MKHTLKGQILSVILVHIEAAVVFFLVWIIAIAATGTRIGGLIYSSVSSLFYAVMMYSQGYSAAKNDKKSISRLTPFFYKGAAISLALTAANVLTAVLYRLAWSLGGDGESLVKIWAVIGNVWTLFWFSPYMNLLGMDKGSIAVYGFVTILLLHTAACFLGYFAGYKNFDISEKFRFLMYEKKK